MEVTQIITGTIEENCYIVSKEHSALIIDPGAESEKIIQTIEQAELQPEAILLTHTHYDHIGAVDELRDRYHIPVYVHSLEKEWLEDPEKNLSADKSEKVTARKAECELETGKDYKIGVFHFKVLHTPGHSPGSVSFIFKDEQLAFTGDALFAGSIGRTDLPGSEPEKLVPAIQTQLFVLPEETRIYPGHRGESTIGHEKKHNPYFQ